MHAPALQTASKTDRVSSNRLCSDGDEVSFACWTRAQDVGSTTPCTCTCSRTPLRAVTASDTPIDAYSSGAASCLASMSVASTVSTRVQEKGRHKSREKGKIECGASADLYDAASCAAAATRVDASSTSAASVYIRIYLQSVTARCEVRKVSALSQA